MVTSCFVSGTVREEQVLTEAGQIQVRFKEELLDYKNCYR